MNGLIMKDEKQVMDNEENYSMKSHTKTKVAHKPSSWPAILLTACPRLIDQSVSSISMIAQLKQFVSSSMPGQHVDWLWTPPMKAILFLTLFWWMCKYLMEIFEKCLGRTLTGRQCMRRTMVCWLDSRSFVIPPWLTLCFSNIVLLLFYTRRLSCCPSNIRLDLPEFISVFAMWESTGDFSLVFAWTQGWCVLLCPWSLEQSLVNAHFLTTIAPEEETCDDDR